MKHCNNCSKCCDLIMIDALSIADIEEKHRRGVIDEMYIEIMKPITRQEALEKNAKAVLEREVRSFTETSSQGLPPREVFFLLLSEIDRWSVLYLPQEAEYVFRLPFQKE